MSEFDKLPDDEIAAMMAATTKSTTTRRRKQLLRDWDTWFFGLDHTLGKCSNPNCIDPREKEMVMTAQVNEIRMCRFCFLAEYDGQ